MICKVPELTHRDIRVLFYYNFKRGLNAEQCLKEINQVFKEKCASRSNVHKWFKSFRDGYTNLDAFPYKGYSIEGNDDDDGVKIIEAHTVSDSEDATNSDGLAPNDAGADKLVSSDVVVVEDGDTDIQIIDARTVVENNENDIENDKHGRAELNVNDRTQRNGSQAKGGKDENIQIKLEPSDILEPETQIETEEYLGINQNGDIQDISDMLIPETRIKPEPMELEYNEFPPAEISPSTPQFNLMDSEDDSQTSFTSSTKSKSDKLLSRKCHYCKKLFSSIGNRIRHERLIHGAKKTSRTSAPFSPTTTSDDRSQHSQHSTDSQELPDQNGNDDTTIEPVDEVEQQKIQFAAGLKLLQKDATPISMEALSKIEISYIEKCKAMATMYKTLECACHKVQHPNVKGLLSHLRSLRIWFPVFTCYNCMITFTDRSSFTKHNLGCRKSQLETIIKLSNLRKRSSVKIRLYQNYKCAECRFMYSFHDEFCKHIDEEHVNNEGPYECTCTRKFTDVEEYKDHIYVSCFVEYYCDICFVTVKTLDAFVKHAQEVHDNSEGFILLQDDNYKHKRSLQNKEKQEKEVKKEEVIITGKRRSSFYNKPILDIDDEDEPRKKPKQYNYVNASTARGAMQNAPPMNVDKPGLCPLCDREYSSYHNMLRHYRTHTDINIPEDDSLYSCPDCGGMYNSTQWRKHLIEKHDTKKCGECGKIFQFQTELDQHRSVHLNLKICRDSKTKSYTSTMISPNSDGETPLMCDLCQQVFGTKEEMQLHQLTHEGIVKTEPVDPSDKYSCKPCNKHYTGYSGLWDHNKKKHPEIKTPSSNFPKKCKYCEKILTTGASYHIHKQMHERMNHIAKNVQDTSSQNTTPVRIKKEKDIDDDDDESQESYHTCHKCFKVFSSKSNLRNHMKSHGISPSTKASKAGVKKAWCNVCHISCDGIEALRQHKEEEHGVDEHIPDLENETDSLDEKLPLIYTCDVCVMTFSNRIALKKHKETHVMEDKKPILAALTVYCKHCKISFDSVAKLANHMREEHDEGLKNKMLKGKDKRAYVCGICKKGFNTALALNAHSGWHKRGPAGTVGKYAKVLKSQKVINKFVQVQSKPPPRQSTSVPQFQCTTCLQELPNDTALQIHILEKHRQIDAIMLVPRCNTCNQDFASQEEYETHKRLHDLLERQKKHDTTIHRVQETTRNSVPSPGPASKKIVKNYHCAYCPAAFTRHDTFMAHMRQNHKEFVKQEYRCHECNRVFEKQNALTIHLKTHFKQPPAPVPTPVAVKTQYQCSICNKGFDLPKDLRTHTINAHPF